jgi:hypothetical protein
MQEGAAKFFSPWSARPCALLSNRWTWSVGMLYGAISAASE